MSPPGSALPWWIAPFTALLLAACAPRPLTWQSAKSEATRQVYDECGPHVFCRSSNMARFLRDHAGCAGGEEEDLDWSSRDSWNQPISETEFVAYSMCMRGRGWPLDPDRVLPRDPPRNAPRNE